MGISWDLNGIFDAVSWSFPEFHGFLMDVHGILMVFLVGFDGIEPYLSVKTIGLIGIECD